MPHVSTLLCLLVMALSSASAMADRFTKIVDEGGESTVTKGGNLVNQKRVAVQKELTQRPPGAEVLGVALPPRSTLALEQTARQIAQYHPVWRVYDYRVEMPRQAFIEHFQKQGLRFDVHANQMKFGNGDEFVDGLFGDPIKSFRVWRRPQ